MKRSDEIVKKVLEESSDFSTREKLSLVSAISANIFANMQLSMLETTKEESYSDWIEKMEHNLKIIYERSRKTLHWELKDIKKSVDTLKNKYPIDSDEHDETLNILKKIRVNSQKK